MRFRINVELIEGNTFPVNFRVKILHMLKVGLKEYDREIFEELFDSTKQKNYTWAVCFHAIKFEKERILFLNENDKRFIINFSIFDNVDSLNIYNAFSSIRFKEFKISDETKVRITNISVVQRKFVKNNVLNVKTLSPVVCRDHDRETEKDKYYVGTDKEFPVIIKRNLYLRLKEIMGEYVEKDIEDLVIDASKTKKVVVKHYDKRSAAQKESSEKESKGILIDASVGTIKFEGKSYLLDYIYSAGLGSVTGSGFGMLEII